MSTQQSTEVALNSFNFGATLKVRSERDKIDIVPEALPNVTNISIVSKDFPSYEECITSCKQLMDDVMKKMNAQNPVFKMGSEVNPIYSGQPTISKDWVPGEISRIWIYDRSMEKTGSGIIATGQARIFGAIHNTFSRSA